MVQQTNRQDELKSMVKEQLESAGLENLYREQVIDDLFEGCGQVNRNLYSLALAITEKLIVSQHNSLRNAAF